MNETIPEIDKQLTLAAKPVNSYMGGPQRRPSRSPSTSTRPGVVPDRKCSLSLG